MVEAPQSSVLIFDLIYFIFIFQLTSQESDAVTGLWIHSLESYSVRHIFATDEEKLLQQQGRLEEMQ